jgi:Uma2 family endonuclease
MAAVPVPVSEREIDDRRRLGIDSLDERWAGEWRLVNPPKLWHPILSTHLLFALAPAARAKGLLAIGDACGLFGAEEDWRVPDQTYARPEDAREEGFVSAELVVEIRSPGDDSYRKLPFYAARGVREVLIVHCDRRAELYRRSAEGEMVAVAPAWSEVVDVDLGAVLAGLPGDR